MLDLFFSALTCSAPFYDDSCGDMGPTWMVQNNIPTSRFLVPFTSSLWHLKQYICRFEGLGCGHLWKSIFYLPHSLKKIHTLLTYSKQQSEVAITFPILHMDKPRHKSNQRLASSLFYLQFYLSTCKSSFSLSHWEFIPL